MVNTVTLAEHRSVPRHWSALRCLPRGAGGCLFRPARSAAWRRAGFLTAATLAAERYGDGAAGQHDRLYQGRAAAMPLAAVSLAIGTTMLGGFYVSALMSGIKTEVPHGLPRLNPAAEGRRDIGETAACLLSTVVGAADAPLQIIILLLALPAVAVQSWLRIASYARHDRAGPRAAAVAPTRVGDV